MSLILILIAIPVAGFVYIVYGIANRGSKVSSTRLPSAIPLPGSKFTPPNHRAGKPRNKVRVEWISPRELGVLALKPEDVLFIDLRSDGKQTLLPFVPPDILCLDPNHLSDVLPWLPSTTSVVLFGGLESCTSLVRAVRNVSRCAAIYVLPSNSLQSKVA